MALNLRQEIHLYFTEALMEDSLSGASDGELAKTFDLNLPPTNLDTFFGHAENMKNRFDDENKARCCEKGTTKRCILGLGMSPNGEDSNEGFILKLLSSPKDESFNESAFSSSPSWLPMFMKPNPDDTLFGVVDTMDMPSLVCMGCKFCHMFIMVSEIAPKCPKCKTVDLLDVSGPNRPVKKARTN